MVNTEGYFNIFSSTGKSGRNLPVLCIFLCLFLSCFIVSCDKFNIFSRPYVATVNGSKIYLEDYQAALNKKNQMLSEEFRKQPDYMKKFEEEVLDGLIAEKIMRLRAQELKISVSDAELESKIQEIKKDYGEDFTGLFGGGNINYEKWKEEFKEELLLQKLIATDVNARIKISEDEIKKYYHEHRRHYRTDAGVRVAQIVVQDLATAQKAMERLKSGEDFSRVAADMSIGPEARRGGDLGLVTRYVMPDPLDKTIFKMSVNRISPIVQSSYGFHIFKVLEIQPAKERSLADVRDDVIDDIRMQREESAFVLWLEELKKKAVIKKEAGSRTTKQNK